MKKIIKMGISALCATAAILTMFQPVFAEEETQNSDESNTEIKYPIIEEKLGNLTIRYFDDSEETIPITGSEFTIMQVSSFGRETTDGTNGAYIPLIEDVNFEGEEDALKYEQKVLEAYEANPELGHVETQTISEDGTAHFIDLPVGAYLVRETKTMRYHVRSKPFLVSVPEMNEENNSWNFDVIANPKQILAGDLSLTKITKGKIAKNGKKYNFTIELNAEGSYKAITPEGETTIKNGDVVALAGGETCVIYDIPAGSKYKIIEENPNVGYVTTYTNSEGLILEKTMKESKIVNDSTTFDTGVHNFPLYAAMGAVGFLVLLILLLICKKNKKSEESEEISTIKEKPEEKIKNKEAYETEESEEKKG